MPEPHQVPSNLPKPHHVAAVQPETHHVSADPLEPHHISADLPEPRHVAAVLPKPCQVSSHLPSHAVLTLSNLTASTLSSPAGIQLSTVLPVMAVAILSVWSTRCTPESSSVMSLLQKADLTP
ncbi:hypothetical protein M9458_058129 [Cirrhinus mrigala]|uniref:Uncharacterized protein n=1 Tax=Cirrhinus mrigala TaxID=683832 RepID=A0ABD0MA61_CIRMR